MAAFAEIVLGGLFHAAVLFLVAAGLQLVFGVQKIVNLACGAFYALGAYVGASAAKWAIAAGLATPLVLGVLVLSGLACAVIGPPIERVLRTVYDRDESFQLLLTFAFLLMFQDLFRIGWGANPQTTGSLFLSFGTLDLGLFRTPAYNVFVIAVAIGVAAGLGWFLQRTNFGRLLRARGRIHGSTLRSRTRAEKADVIRRLREDVLPLLEEGRVTVPVHATYPLDQAQDAYDAFAAGGKFGKIVLLP